MSTAIIVVDVQNDFCEGGSLAVPGGAGIAGAISAWLTSAEADHVVATRDHHIDPGAHFATEPDYRDTWPPHCVVGTIGVELHPNLRSDRIEAVFDKGHYDAAYSGFEGHSEEGTLVDWLRARQVNTIEVVGLTSDHCVRATALDAALEGFDTTVRLDLTAGVALETTERAIRQLKEAGVRLIGRPLVGTR